MVQKLCHEKFLIYPWVQCAARLRSHHYGRHGFATLAILVQMVTIRGEPKMEQVRLDEIARKLVAGLPDAARTMRRDLESNFRAILQAQLGRLDLTTRDEFEVQTKVLERTRALLEQLEQRVQLLEEQLKRQQG
jgi:BMFP domain-containing protein YqiC